MKYLWQFFIILGFTMLGKVLQIVIPIPIPASVYGMVLLFAALCLKLIKVEQVKEAGGFLTGLLPILFVSPAVGIAQQWHMIAPNLLPIALLVVATTALTFGITGTVTQSLRRKEDKSRE